MPISADDLQALIYLQIEGAMSAANQYGEGAENGPVAGSKIDFEMNHNGEFDIDAKPWGSQATKSALSLAGVATQATGHFLLSLGQLLRPGEPLSLFGFQVVARSCVEAAARAWWLLDPSINARERVARAMTEQAQSIAEQGGAEKASGQPGGNASDL